MQDINIQGYINGYQRIRPTQGPLYENNIIINSLPEIGSMIVIEEIEILSNKIRYRLSPSRLDAWNRPRIFKVIGYTEGINNPLSPFNKMRCQYCLDSDKNIVFETDFQTIHIVTGSMRCIEASPERMKKWGYGTSNGKL